jgi:hypothetical protein
MQITFADSEGEHFIITTAGGVPVSGCFDDSLQAEAVLVFLTAVGIKDDDLDGPYDAPFSLTLGGVDIGFRSEWSKKLLWLITHPAWILVVDALDVSFEEIVICQHPQFGETLAIKRRPALA